MIDTIWPGDTLATVPGSTDGLTPLAARIYDWLRGTYEREGKPVRAGETAYLFGTVHRIRETRIMPQDALAELVDASLVYVVQYDLAGVVHRETQKRVLEIRQKLQGGPL